MKSKNYHIDIIVPIYRNEKLTKACVDSLLENVAELIDYSPRIILVNDSPDYEPINEMLSSFENSHNSIILIKNEVNIGFVKSVNKALSISRNEGRAVILVNSDTLTFVGTLKKLVSAAELDPQIGFACPRSNNAALSTMPRLPHNNAGLSITPAQNYKNWRFIANHIPEITFSPTAVGFYLFIKREVVLEFGILDERYGFGYEEENDLVMRANKVGYRAVLANHSFAYHAGSASFLLKDVDLNESKKINLEKLNSIHPEFIPLVRKFESSPAYLSENLLKNLIPSCDGLISIIFDLSRLGGYSNGTSELAVAIIGTMSRIYSDKFKISLFCSKDAFEYHGFNKLDGVRRQIEVTGDFTVAINLGQPFDLHQINVLERLAPINIYGMLDTIAHDCGYLAVNNDTDLFWDYVAKTASGVFFISEFSEKTFTNRFFGLPSDRVYSKLLSTSKRDYDSKYRNFKSGSEHILVLGNHFRHKNSDKTAAEIAGNFPSASVVVLGSSNFISGNLRGYRSGEIDDDVMRRIFANAGIVVLPSYYEGFGFGLMHALALDKPIVAKDIPVTREIINCFKDVEGVYLYGGNDELFECINQASELGFSRFEEFNTTNWDEFVQGFVCFIDRLISSKNLYADCVARIAYGDLLRSRAVSINSNGRPSNSIAEVNATEIKSFGDGVPDVVVSPISDLNELLSLNGDEFIFNAYLSLLRRECDEQGLIYYSERLHRGQSKIDILRDIKNSKEGRLVKPHVFVPDSQFGIVRRAFKSLLGRRVSL
jgi:GT2 family glycosyltransferase/glycosyltransferase involved in cell wall biosynthesis